ncbi:MAG: dihydrofolate reductase family protein [Erysipelotrichaceae bacterium]
MSKPYVICHMLTSLDGKIDGDFFQTDQGAMAVSQFAKIRRFYNCSATLYGTTTMLGSYSAGLVNLENEDDSDLLHKDYLAQSEVNNYLISIDPKGTLAFDSKYIAKKNRAKAAIVEVLTEQVSNRYLSYLRKKDISYLFAGKQQLDCHLLLEKLNNYFGIEKLLISGGGLINWSFMQENLIDEVSIVIAPVADGNRTSVSIFEKADFLSERKPATFSLKEVQQTEGDVLWLRYLVNK